MCFPQWNSNWACLLMRKILHCDLKILLFEKVATVVLTMWRIFICTETTQKGTRQEQSLFVLTEKHKIMDCTVASNQSNKHAWIATSWKKLKTKHLKDARASLADAKKRNNSWIPHDMVRSIVHTSKSSMPWITRYAIGRAFPNFERCTQLNTVKLFNSTPNTHKEVTSAMANLFPSPEPSSESSPETSVNESSRKGKTSKVRY